MYLLTYSYDNLECTGFLNEEKNGVIPSSTVFSKLNIPVPTDMLNLIDSFNNLEKEKINEIILSCKEVIDLDKVKILSPIPYPKRNVICLGKNYMDHISEVKSLKSVTSDVPSKPIYFSKIAYPAIGNKEFVDSHSNIVKELDYEVELAVIIGKKCKNISKEEAEDYIFGYTIANDISARDIQTSHVQWHKGKSFDTFCPLGPYIVHKSKISFPPKLAIKSYINDELRQNGNTSQLIFDIPTILSDLSSGITLYPGDIILTGTPAGVGAGFNPPKYLKSGDKMECVIEGIGTLINTVK
ncbi:MAG: fumarylacetoacetate hydrolase family protein [Sedimentibacter sp.]|uniref:fumarylacetoacetate hydrolase family protein n=1 Tax=Sedimentibacter sp. TaxID=1960295 RepID=UPI002982929B|nr:fumarylacetoacetate hydrolase family protein [Sedimentibacter sp.]MDW5299297.1 fumarylacetoacetate hydrolase family protein [Sedimentibacter sp.]